jgi:hypothetical protein
MPNWAWVVLIVGVVLVIVLWNEVVQLWLASAGSARLCRTLGRTVVVLSALWGLVSALSVWFL